MGLWAGTVENYYRLMFSRRPLVYKLQGLFYILKEKEDFYHAYKSAAGIMAYGGKGFISPFSRTSFQHRFLLFLYRKNLSRPLKGIVNKIQNPPPNPFILRDLLAAGWEGKSGLPEEALSYLKELKKGFPSLTEAEKFYLRYSKARDPETSLFFVFWYLNALLVKRRAAQAFPLIRTWEGRIPFRYPFWFLRHFYYAIAKQPQQRLLFILRATEETERLYLLDLHNLYKRMLATSYGKLGKFNEALEKFNQILGFCRTFGKKTLMVDVLVSRAYLFYENYLYEAAREDLSKALEFMRAPSYKRAYVYSLLSMVLIKLNKPEEADRYARLGQREAKRFGFFTALYASELALARALMSRGKVEEALEMGKGLEEVGRRKQDRELLFSSLELERQCYLRLGDYSRAADKIKEALSYAPTDRDRLKIYLELYKVYRFLGKDGFLPWVVYSLRAYPYIVKARALASRMRMEDFPSREIRYELLKNSMEIYTLFGKASLDVARILVGIFLFFSLLVGAAALLVGRVKGNVLGSYQILKEIGRGGMGVVYQGRSLKKGKRVALKVIDGIRASPEELRGFLREAEILKKLSHPNVVRFFESGQEGSTLYIAMEYIRGTSLASISRESPPPFPLSQVKEVALGTSRALSYLHENKVVHRDVKPSNILIEGHFKSLEGVKSQEVKLTDFGIARTLRTLREATSNITGTPHFIPPETLKSGLITPASDIYSFGVVVFWMLTGKFPFHHPDLSVLISWILTSPAPPVSQFVEVPRCWVDFVETCLAKNPEERFSSGAELLDALLYCGPID